MNQSDKCYSKYRQMENILNLATNKQKKAYLIKNYKKFGEENCMITLR